MRRSSLLALGLALFAARPLAAQADSAARDWNTPVTPFRIAGNLWYVGAKEVSAFLLTSDSGHILVDAGFEQTAPQILANITRLGFNPRDVKALLSTHGHYDHAGGFAALKAATGASLSAAEGDAELIERGGRGDFAFGDRFLYPATRVEHRIQDGNAVRVGPLVMRAILTPGHTRGCTTWTTTVREGDRDLAVAIVCSLTAPGYRLSGRGAIPGIASAFRQTFTRLDSLRPDIFLSAHGSTFDLLGKIARRGGDANPFVDPAEFPAYLSRARRAIEVQATGQAPAVDSAHGCFRGRPIDRCSWFPLIEMGASYRFTDRIPDDENYLINWTLGFMKNTGPRTAFGGEVTLGVEGEARLTIGMRARRWLSDERSVEVAAGMHVAGDASSGSVQAGSPMVMARWNEGDYIAGTLRFDLLRIRRPCDAFACPGRDRTSPRLYAGIELGSYPGVVGVAATGVLIVIALVALQDCCDYALTHQVHR